MVEIVATMRQARRQGHGVLTDGTQFPCRWRDIQFHGCGDLSSRGQNRHRLVKGAQKILCQINCELSARKDSPSRRRVDQCADHIKYQQRLATAVGNGSVPNGIGKINDATEELCLTVDHISKQGDNGLHLRCLNRTTLKPHAKEDIDWLIRIRIDKLSSNLTPRNQWIIPKSAVLNGSKETQEYTISLGPFKKGCVSVNPWADHPLIPLEGIHLKEWTRGIHYSLWGIASKGGGGCDGLQMQPWVQPKAC